MLILFLSVQAMGLVLAVWGWFNAKKEREEDAGDWQYPRI